MIQGDVRELPFGDGSFDQVTAFETVYFWPDLENAFRQVLRCCGPVGAFLSVMSQMGKTRNRRGGAASSAA